MLERRQGSWTVRRRPGREDATLLAAERLHELRQRSFAELERLAGAPAEVARVSGPSGDHFSRRARVQRAPHGELGITVAVTDGSLRGRP